MIHSLENPLFRSSIKKQSHHKKNKTFAKKPTIFATSPGRPIFFKGKKFAVFHTGFLNASGFPFTNSLFKRPKNGQGSYQTERNRIYSDVILRISPPPPKALVIADEPASSLDVSSQIQVPKIDVGTSSFPVPEKVRAIVGFLIVNPSKKFHVFSNLTQT